MTATCICAWFIFYFDTEPRREPNPDCLIHFPLLPPSANTGNTARSSGWYGGHE